MPGQPLAAVHRDPGRDAQSAPTASRTASSVSSQNRPAVGQCAPVAVGPLVGVGGEELGEQVAVGAVDVHDVEADVARTLRGLDPVALDARGCRRRSSPWPGRSTARSDDAWLGARRVARDWPFAAEAAAVEQLDAGQRRRGRAQPRRVRPSARASSSSQKQRRHGGRLLGLLRDRRVVDADPAPAALGLDGAERRLGRVASRRRSPTRAAPGRSGWAGSWGRAGSARTGSRDAGPRVLPVTWLTGRSASVAAADGYGAAVPGSSCDPRAAPAAAAG